MAVDLADYVDVLTRALSVPGSNLFPDATSGQLVGYLSDSMWEGKLYGLYTGFDESDGIITPETAGDPDITRDWIQLIAIWAAYNIVFNEFREKNTSFRAKAGPVEYETQNSAQVLREHLRVLEKRRDEILQLLSSKYTLNIGFVDLVCARTNAISYGIIGFDSGVSF